MRWMMEAMRPPQMTRNDTSMRTIAQVFISGLLAGGVQPVWLRCAHRAGLVRGEVVDWFAPSQGCDDRSCDNHEDDRSPSKQGVVPDGVAFVGFADHSDHPGNKHPHQHDGDDNADKARQIAPTVKLE